MDEFLLNGKEKVFTLKQLSELSKGENKPNGFSRQYLNKEIKRGNIKAIMFNGLHLVKEEDMKDYLNRKKIFLLN